MKITKTQLQKIIKEEIKRLAERDVERVRHYSPATLISQANDKVGEALEMLAAQRGSGFDENYETVKAHLEIGVQLKDALVAAGRK